MNRDLITNLYSSLRVQQTRYTYLVTSRELNRLTIALDAYYRMTRSIYFSLSIEHAIESDYKTDRLYSEITWRF